MRNNTVRKIVSIILIALLICATKVYAANDSFGTTVKASTTQVKREDNITITIGLKDIKIESGEKGIGAYTASIKFDASVLEYVSTNSTDKWEAPFYQNGLITGNTKDGEVVNSTQNIGTITFKVKKDAKLGETTIGLTNFSGSTAESDVSASDVSIKVTIVDDKNTGDSGNNSGSSNTGNNNSGNNNTGNNTGNNNSGNNNSGNNNSSNNNSNKEPSNVNDNTIVNETLPKTGTTEAILLMTIGVSALLGTVSFIKMTNTNIR